MAAAVAAVAAVAAAVAVAAVAAVAKPAAAVAVAAAKAEVVWVVWWPLLLCVLRTAGTMLLTTLFHAPLAAATAAAAAAAPAVAAVHLGGNGGGGGGGAVAALDRRATPAVPLRTNVCVRFCLVCVLLHSRYTDRDSLQLRCTYMTNDNMKMHSTLVKGTKSIRMLSVFVVSCSCALCHNRPPLDLNRNWCDLCGNLTTACCVLFTKKSAPSKMGLHSILPIHFPCPTQTFSCMLPPPLSLLLKKEPLLKLYGNSTSSHDP